MKLLVLLLGCLCLCNATVVRADPKPPAKPTQTTKKKSVLVKFIVARPSGSSQQGSTGDYLPSAANVDPATKDYYTSIVASITVPRSTNLSMLPNTLEMRARRVRRTTTTTGATKLVFVGPVLDTLPILRRMGDVVIERDTATVFYSSLGSDPMTASESLESRRVARDWNISKERGRWLLSIKRESGASKRGEFKIDKRGQITGAAIAWADYYEYKQSNAATQAELDKWSTTSSPDKLWSHCFSFANYIYTRHGLKTIGNTGTATFAAASAVDDGPGSLRLYWTNVPGTPTAGNDPGHVGIIGPNTRLGYGTRIDNNGLPVHVTRGWSLDGVLNPYRFNGPLWRPKDEGVGDAYFGSETTSPRPPKSRTLAGERNPAISLLQELDGE